MRGLLSFSRGIDRVSRAVGVVAGWLTLVMVLVAAANAIARYLDRWTGLGLSSNAWIELQWYLFSLVFLLGAAATLRADRHVRVDVFYSRLPERGRHWIDLLGGLLLLLPFAGFALVVSWPVVWQSWSIREVSPDPGGLPRWPVKAVVLVAFLLLFLQGLSETIKRLALLRGYDRAEVGLDEPGGHESEERGA